MSEASDVQTMHASTAATPATKYFIEEVIACDFGTY